MFLSPFMKKKKKKNKQKNNNKKTDIIPYKYRHRSDQMHYRNENSYCDFKQPGEYNNTFLYIPFLRISFIKTTMHFKFMSYCTFDTEYHLCLKFVK